MPLNWCSHYLNFQKTLTYTFLLIACKFLCQNHWNYFKLKKGIKFSFRLLNLLHALIIKRIITNNDDMDNNMLIMKIIIIKIMITKMIRTADDDMDNNNIIIIKIMITIIIIIILCYY